LWSTDNIQGLESDRVYSIILGENVSTLGKGIFSDKMTLGVSTYMWSMQKIHPDEDFDLEKAGKSTRTNDHQQSSACCAGKIIVIDRGDKF
jgi:hypothetical protein